MADEKGTGQHSHKSSEEPYPHHEAPTTRGESGSSGSGSSSSHSSGGSSRDEKNSGSSNESSDLKSREYRDNEGNVHHHTRTSEAMNSGSSGERRDDER